MSKKRLVLGRRQLRANQKEGEKIGSSWRNVRKKVWSKKILNEEVGNDVIEVLCISSDSDGFPCLLVWELLAPDVPLTDTGCMCVPCGPQWFVSHFRKTFATQGALKFR